MSKLFIALAAGVVLASAAQAQSYDPEKGGANVVNEPAAQHSKGTVGRGPNAVEYDSKGKIHAGPQETVKSDVKGKHMPKD